MGFVGFEIQGDGAAFKIPLDVDIVVIADVMDEVALLFPSLAMYAPR